MNKLFKYEYKCLMCGWTALSNDEKDKDIKLSICDDCFDELAFDLKKKNDEMKVVCKEIIVKHDLRNERIYINRLNERIRIGA